MTPLTVYSGTQGNATYTPVFALSAGERNPLMNLADAAASGDRIAALQALRDRLAQELDGCESSRDVAALASRLQSVLAELDTIAPPIGAETPLDVLRARRAERRADLTQRKVD